ncbi:MAG: hypothetical protein RBR54_08235 [Sulfurimonas sp.]|jgi:ABC-type methionine transport system permease subunit|nr:hypothetical protein [Sulfurimonas sp.]
MTSNPVLVYSLVFGFGFLLLYGNYLVVKKGFAYLKNKRTYNMKNNVQEIKKRPFFIILFIGFYPLYYILNNMLGVHVNTNSLSFYIAVVGLFSLFFTLSIIEYSIIEEANQTYSFLSVILAYIVGIAYMLHLLS